MIYLITITKGTTQYTYGRQFTEDEKNIAVDTLQAVYKMKIIDSFKIKEVTSLENINFY